MKTFNFKSRYGTEYELAFEKATYAYFGNLAIEVHCKDKRERYAFWEPYATLTVNLDPVMPNMAYLDSNNVPDLCEFVIDKGWAEKIGEGTSGFCTYPLVLFTDEFLNDVCEVVE